MNTFIQPINTYVCMVSWNGPLMHGFDKCAHLNNSSWCVTKTVVRHSLHNPVVDLGVGISGTSPPPLLVWPLIRITVVHDNFPKKGQSQVKKIFARKCADILHLCAPPF